MKKYIILLGILFGIISSSYFSYANDYTGEPVTEFEEEYKAPQYDSLQGSFRIMNNNNTVQPQDGVCGTAHNREFVNKPVDNLCSVGTGSPIQGKGPWSWECLGEKGGAATSCSATKKTPPKKGGNPTVPTDVVDDPDVTVDDPVVPTPKEPDEPIKDEPKEPIPEKPVEKTPEEPKNTTVEQPEEVKITEIPHFYKEEGKSLIKKYPYKLLETGTSLEKRVKTIFSPYIETATKKEDFRLAGTRNSDINHWKQVLPAIDKNADKIIVIPSSGLVMPISELDKGNGDYKKALEGEVFDYKEAMKNGAFEFPGTSTNSYGEVGNKVLFGHSSYWKKDNGRYKTHFQKIIELDAGEEIWIYKKNEKGEYIRYTYMAQKSYVTTPDNVKVMEPGYGRKLTLITCTPIGGITGRWVVQAELIEDIQDRQEQESENKKMKRYEKIIDKYVTTVIEKSISFEKKREVLGNIYKKLAVKKKTTTDQDTRYFISYFQKRILLEFKRLK